MRMAKTPERVRDFLSDLKKRLQTLKQQELELFLTYKKEDVCLSTLSSFILCRGLQRIDKFRV
jgi:Zn-dependent oligopeptidase